jgi:hypothetical protein
MTSIKIICFYYNNILKVNVVSNGFYRLVEVPEHAIRGILDHHCVHEVML